MNAHTTTTATITPIHLDDRPDDEIAAMLQQMIDACPAPEPERELTAVERASALVGESAARLKALLDRAATGKDLGAEIWSARRKVDDDRMRLATHIEIEAIGDIADRPYVLRPSWEALKIAVYRDGEDEPAFSFPHGLGRTAALAVLDAHARGYDAGHRDGGNAVRAAITDVLQLR
ncbi:hypothetical protein PUR29_33225 [Methylobacterium ajmalii]|uniref:Uncharacterized protein n=1 Tax=Methylobacterium ajmalii TaxID=2738439 RepID=A0ABV0A399_9HYPH